VPQNTAYSPLSKKLPAFWRIGVKLTDALLITRHDVASPLTFSKTNRAPWGGVDFEITFHVLAYAG
jgi:hypothetical protein